MHASEQKALDDIEQYGCHVINVLEEDGKPPFAYSIGIERTANSPELIVVGLKQELAHFIINEYHHRVSEGEVFEDGQFVSGFLGDFDCNMRTVAPENFKKYMGWARWLYAGDNFRALQLIYPTTAGIWPWDQEADEWFKGWQHLLFRTENEAPAR